MAYERVQKLFGQSSSLKKHTPLVPPIVDHPIQADSQLSPLVKPSRIPSSEEREAIKRKIFDSISRSGENQAIMREGLFSPTVREQKTPDSASAIGMPIQPKLTIGAPGDKYEQEADRVAAQVVNLLNAPDTQQKSQNQEREVLSVEEEELQMKPMVQLQPGAGGMTATPEVETSIQQARGGGQSLADNIREPMEQAFGADFSGVKVHTDTQADQLNQSIQAKAFTTGQDVFFRQGEYSPGSRGGQELLAHELTHVVQQNGRAVQRSPLPPQQLPQQTTSESSSAKAKEKKPKQMKQAAMLPMEPTLQRKISYKKGRYRSRDELKSALVTIFGEDAEKEIDKRITEVENWKESVFTNYAFDSITDYMKSIGYKPNYAVSTEDSTGKHGPKLPDRPDRDTLESKPDAAMSAFNFSSVTLGRITIWHLGEEISFHDRNVDENVHAEDGLIDVFLTE